MRVDGAHIPAAALVRNGDHGKAATNGAPDNAGANNNTTPTLPPPAVDKAPGAVPPLSGATAVAAQLAAQAQGAHGEDNPAMMGKAMYASDVEGDY